ncbi:MAG: DEAD/DEAH box helicase, partial [Acidimicrobiales bacterium]
MPSEPLPEHPTAGAAPSAAAGAGRAATQALAAIRGALPGGGEERPGQQAMASAVAGAVARGRHLVVQAGTGTGKTFAYLVPALLSGRKVVVATATKALQDQLAERDLPMVAGHLGQAVDVAVLKGRANYLCLQKVAEMRDRGRQGRLEDAGGDARTATGEQVVALLRWAEHTTSG